MKVYIFKDASGEYDSYEEHVRKVYLVDDSMPSVEELEVKFGQFILEERKKAKESSVRWTQAYIAKNGFVFENWFEKNYAFTIINFEEHTDYIR